MKLWLEKREFSWDDQYNIYEENGQVCYKIKGVDNGDIKTITLMNQNDMELGYVKQTRGFFSPKFEIFLDDNFMASIEKQSQFGVTRYSLKYRRWRVFGNILGWEYDIFDEQFLVLHVGCEDPDFPGKYVLDASYSNNDVPALLVVLGMEAANNYLKNK